MTAETDTDEIVSEDDKLDLRSIRKYLMAKDDRHLPLPTQSAQTEYRRACGSGLPISSTPFLCA